MAFLSVKLPLRFFHHTLCIFELMKDKSANKEWRRDYLKDIVEIYRLDKQIMIGILSGETMYWFTEETCEEEKEKNSLLFNIYYRIMVLSIQHFAVLQSYLHYIDEEMREEAEANEITEAEYKSKIEEYHKYYDNVSRLREQIMGYFGGDEKIEMTPPEYSCWNKDHCLHWIWEGDSDSECSCEDCAEWKTSDEED